MDTHHKPSNTNAAVHQLIPQLNILKSANRYKTPAIKVIHPSHPGHVFPIIQAPPFCLLDRYINIKMFLFIKMEFKKSFLDRYKELTDIEEFKEYCSKELRKSIRVNTLKISVKEFLDRTNLNLERIKWFDEGFFVNERITLGNLYAHFLGYFYVQESASMLPSLALDVKNMILDMCAAPGSKTGQIASIMKNNGLIVANDFDYKRLKALTLNLQI